MEKLKALGIDPYPNNSQRDATCAEVIGSFDAWMAAGKEVCVAGRLMTIRIHGGIAFADVQDQTGRMQIALKQDEVGDDVFAPFRDLMDPGDVIEARGVLFQTKRGEKTLAVRSWRLLSKALLPLPEKWHGLQDVEMRSRERELDLLTNEDVRARFVIRSQLLSTMRRFFEERGFMEVETPLLQLQAGGANARPFVTHHHALDIDLFLRIAPELYLKRLLVGGFEKIFEVGRCFRNEGIDYSHNPEFTMLELYWAYSDKETFLSFLEEMLTTMILSAFKTLEIKREERTLTFHAPWPRVTFREAVMQACGVDVDALQTREEVEAAVEKRGLSIDFSTCVGIEECLDELYKKTARATMTGPVWVMDYPVRMIPLAGRSSDDPTKSATAQLVIEGMEVIKAFYHELHNPIDQRERLEAQQKLAEQGSEEAQRVDEGFLRALEHGMPPAAGMGMGIDRLTALLTGSPNLKEVILFPTLRPEK